LSIGPCGVRGLRRCASPSPSVDDGVGGRAPDVARHLDQAAGRKHRVARRHDDIDALAIRHRRFEAEVVVDEPFYVALC
jgi:hypothetical protein